jgi:hypothetical protein
METPISENLIANIWQSGRLAQFVADSGETIQVIHPGRFTHGTGSDFQDAVLLIRDQKAHGGIEIHVKSSQWYSHKHHLNPRYNSTVLHVVYTQDKATPTMLQNGKSIPTVSLSTLAGQHLDVLSEGTKAKSQAPPCSCITGQSTEQLTALLTAAGKQRFADKAYSFLKALKSKGAGQVLFEGLARALGYSQNSEAFQRLANMLTLHSIEHLQLSGEATRQAFILGSAGLLPSQRAKEKQESVTYTEIEELEQNWRTLSPVNIMSETDWCFFRVRPDNSPTRRLVALAYLINKYHKLGLLQGLLRLVAKAEEEVPHRLLIDGLTLSAQGYWAKHYDFGVADPRGPALIGYDRASEIAINVLLPFAVAWSRITADAKLERKAAEIYLHFPKPSDNELTRYMRQQLLLTPDTRLSACHQQGLLHIFKNCCRYRACAICPINAN